MYSEEVLSGITQITFGWRWNFANSAKSAINAISRDKGSVLGQNHDIQKAARKAQIAIF
jgi:hypothetical protein